jgi:hypothetical protein
MGDRSLMKNSKNKLQRIDEFFFERKEFRSITISSANITSPENRENMKRQDRSPVH